MKTRPTGILQFNQSEDRVEIIRVVNNSTQLYQLEEFLTGKAMDLVPAKQLSDIRQQEHLHLWGKELFAMQNYSKLLRDIHRLVVHQGDNQAVFGDRTHQELLLLSAGPVMKVGLRISNKSMLRALGTTTAGIMMDGELLREGTVTSYRSVLEMVEEKVRHYINSIPTECREALRRQWNASCALHVHELEHYHVGRLYDAWEGLMDAPKVCDVLAVSSTTLSRYRSGQVPGGADPFPDPVRFRGRSPYWSRAVIEQWMANRRH